MSINRRSQRGRREPRFVYLLWVMILWPALCSGQAPDLVDQAKKEGEVVLYATMTVPDFEVFNKAAKEKYPFLNIRHVYLSSARQAARVMQEHRAGRVQADVLGNSVEAMLYFKQQEVISAYRSPETKNLIGGVWDPEGYWSGMTTDLLITGFNPKMISKAAAPKSYEEYLKPQFKGQMAVNRGVSYSFTGMVSLRGEEQGIAYLKKLSQQEPRLIEGYTHMTNLLAAGEYPLAIFTQVSKDDAMRRKGAPVDWLPGSLTFATISTVAITRNPLHVASARLLVDFYLSVEGQQALARAGKIPVRRGVKSLSKEIDQLLESDNLHVIRPEGDYGRYMKLYNEILGVR
jgi:iron(III) transport system substrate-binding protein